MKQKLTNYKKYVTSCLSYITHVLHTNDVKT